MFMTIYILRKFHHRLLLTGLLSIQLAVSESHAYHIVCSINESVLRVSAAHTVVQSLRLGEAH